MPRLAFSLAVYLVNSRCGFDQNNTAERVLKHREEGHYFNGYPMCSRCSSMRCRLIHICLGLALACLCHGCGKADPRPPHSARAKARKTRICPQCKKPLLPGWVFCPYCGAKAPKEIGKARKGVPVRVAAVKRGNISDYILFTSVVEAKESVDVYAQGTGLIKQLLVEEGDTVEKGQLLAQLVDDELAVTEAKAKVAFDKKDAEYKRISEMHAKGIASDEQFENVRYEREQANLEWRQAKLNLEHARIEAPIAGVVAKREVRLGDRVTPATRAFCIVAMNDLVINVAIPGQEMQKVKADQEALITSDFLPGAKFAGRVERLSPVVDPESGTFKAVIQVAEGKEGLKPGMFVDVRLLVDTHKNVILLPKKAIVYEGDLKYAFVVRDGLAYKTELHVGFSDIDNVEVASGLNEGDRVVVVGQIGLKDKAKVRIIER